VACSLSFEKVGYTLNMTSPDRKELLARFQSACASAAAEQSIKKSLRKELAAQPEALRAALIDDLKRVFESPDNPFKGFAASRQRYRQLGYFPEILVVDAFGNHEEFLREAGLRDKRNTTRVRNKAALLNTHQNVAAYAERELAPFHGAFQNSLPDGVFHAAVGSDFHSWFADPFALRVWFEVLKIVKPAQVVLNGDVVDFPQISRHRKLPGHFNLNLQQEIDFARREILMPTRAAAPDANMLLTVGNHEYRFVNYLADTAPDLAALSVYDDKGNEIPVTFESLFGLKALKIGLVCRQNFLAPYDRLKKRELQENWIVLADTLVVTHGISCAKFAADEQLKRYQKSGTSGHTHRPQIITGNSLGTGALSWTSTPMMAGFAVGRDYVSEPSVWNMGFSIFTIDTKNRRVVPQLVLVHEDFATFAGHVWRPTAEELARREEQWGRG